MADAEYKLSTELVAHALDVRSVAVAKEDCILSASRDKTAKLWHPEGVKDFTNVVTYLGHKNFVSCVCWVGPCEAQPEGAVATGSNDNTINLYSLQYGTVLLTLRGHENALSHLSCGRLPAVLLSASWDNTARVWNLNRASSPPLCLKGHRAAVWAVVELANSTYATASADKTIMLWNKEGATLRTLTGHKDCVRGLTVASPETFVSCSNDATIKLWTNQGECLNTYFGHSNYIYSVCTNPALPGCVVSCGEDSTVRVWRAEDNVRSITLPAQSVWTVACLSNGDIVTGSSDGVVRVFTKDASRFADDAALAKFEEEVMKLQDASKQEIGGFKLSELPGPEVLFEPGKSDGQTKLVRHGANVKAHSWSAASQSWTELGDVMGSNPASEGKTMYQGKEYDFVFSVDIEDGAPPLKLPYNKGEDPWVSAQAFIHKNQLPQVYLDQVANFIVTNAKLEDLPASNNVADPFTGESRYVPGSAPPRAAGPGAPVPAAAADPFTGAGAYTTAAARRAAERPLFPHDTYLRFDQANLSQIHEKLKEFNQRVGDGSSALSPAQLEAVVKLGEQNASYNPETLPLLRNLLEWPREILFPVLDVTRLAIRNKEVNEQLFGGTSGPQFIKFLISLLSDNSAANQMLSMRTLVNAFSHLPGEMMVLAEQLSIFHPLAAVKELNKNAQIAAATLLLNMSVALGQQEDTEDLAECLVQLLTRLTDNEAHFRALVALGTLLVESPKKLWLQTKLVTNNSLSQKLRDNCQRPHTADPALDKIASCSEQIIQLL